MGWDYLLYSLLICNLVIMLSVSPTGVVPQLYQRPSTLHGLKHKLHAATAVIAGGGGNANNPAGG